MRKAREAIRAAPVKSERTVFGGWPEPPERRVADRRKRSGLAPHGLRWIGEGVTWAELDDELNDLYDELRSQARYWRFRARRSAARGNLAAWRAHHAKARAFDAVALRMRGLGLPF